MKAHLLIISFFSISSIFSQTISSIDEHIQNVEQIKFTDSITILKFRSQSNHSLRITGYFLGDSLLKSYARFTNSSRIRITYYKKDNIVYAKDFDSVTNIIYAEAYGPGYTVLKSKMDNRFDNEDKSEPYQFLINSDFSTELGFANVGNKAKKYVFKVKLVNPVVSTPHCGFIAFAVVLKFQVLLTNYPNYNQQYVLLIQPCPEFLKQGFFEAGRVYDLDVATNSGVTFGFTLVNNFEKEKLPTFWIREIKKVN